jgi:hypothetical protein
MRIPPKIEIRNNEINARNLSFFLLIVSILLLLNLCLDMTNGLLALWTILTNLYKKNTTDVVSSNIKQGDVYNIT